eukprot:6766825-Prymnesium_polylepis.1
MPPKPRVDGLRCMPSVGGGTSRAGKRRIGVARRVAGCHDMVKNLVLGPVTLLTSSRRPRNTDDSST